MSTAPEQWSITGGPARVDVAWIEPAGAAYYRIELLDPLGRPRDLRRVEALGEGEEHALAFTELPGPAAYTVRLVAVDPEGVEQRVVDTVIAGYAVDGAAVDVDLYNAYPLRPTGSVIGTAHLAEERPAGVVLVRRADGTIVDASYPTETGDYAAHAEGPVLLEAHAFDPVRWRGSWQPETAYSVGDVVFPSRPNSESLILRALAGGTSGAEEPEFVADGETLDGELTWQALGTIRECAPVVNYYIAPEG